MEKHYYLELCRRIAFKEDKAAFDLLFESYYPKLIKVAAYFLGSYTYADDVVSEVFVKFLNQGEKIAGIKDPENYFFVATKNHALTYLKQQHEKWTNPETKLKLTVSNINPENTLIEKEIQEIIEKTIDQFPTKRKIIFEMIKEENMSYKEVAQNLDLTVKAVEKQMNLAMKELRLKLNSYYEDFSKPNKSQKTFLSSLSILFSLFFLA